MAAVTTDLVAGTDLGTSRNISKIIEYDVKK
jgi:hypothetical protein